MKFKKIFIILLLPILILLVSCNNNEEDEPPIYIEPPVLEEIMVEKDETVYVNLDSSGNVLKIDVINHLLNADLALYKDFGNFKDAFSITNSNEVNIFDNYLELPLTNHYENYYYQTELNITEELPFNVNLKYYHNDILKDINSIAGVSGKVKIEIKVTYNKNVCSEYQNNLSFQLQVPISIINNEIINHNATSTVLVGKNMTLAFMVMPKQDKTFYIELDSKYFTLDNMQASIQSFNLENMLGFNISDLLDGANSLVDGLISLEGGSGELLDGLNLIDENLELINNGLIQLKNGNISFNEGLNEIITGLNTLNDNALLISDGLNDFYDGLVLLSDGLNELKGGVDQIKEGANLLATNGDDLVSGFNELYDAYIEIINGLSNVTWLPGMPSKEELEALKNGTTDFKDGLGLYHGGVLELSNGLNQLSEGLDLLVDNLPEIINGAYSLNEGFNQFKDGLNLLVDNLPELKDGSGNINNGLIELSDGLNELSSGFSEIPEGALLLNNGLEEVVNGISEMFLLFDTFPLSNNNKLPSFTSSLNNKPNSLQFVYQIKGITTIK